MTELKLLVETHGMAKELTGIVKNGLVGRVDKLEEILFYIRDNMVTQVKCDVIQADRKKLSRWIASTLVGIISGGLAGAVIASLL